MKLTDELPIYHCPRIPTPLRIDGDIWKPAWQTIPAHWLLPATGRLEEELWEEVGDETLFAPEEPLRNGPPGSGAGARPLSEAFQFQPTAFRACWSATHLYLAFQCADRDIWGTYQQRDDPLYEEEVVEAFLSPSGDVRHYYEFEVSPRNVVFDAAVHSPHRRRASMTVLTVWDCPGLETAVQVCGTLDNRQDADRWWSVEIAIPFIGFPHARTPRPGDSWRANFYRIDRSDPPEFTAWSPTLKDPPDFHVPERFGHLVFDE